MSSSDSLPSIAGISIPATKLVTAAVRWARNNLEPWSRNHVFRCLYLGFAIADNTTHLQTRDRELHALASILHDMSWEPTNKYSSPDKRFEVDGANAARDLVRSVLKGNPELRAQWNEQRLQLLWDAIALHTTPSIALYKETEVAATGLGIVADFFGPQGMKNLGVKLEESQWEAICSEYPRDGFKDGVSGVCRGLCSTKPHTTWDNWVGDFGEELKVEGYERKGNRFVDFVLHVMP